MGKKRGERGAVLVEFVLILPVFLLLLFGGLDMSITVGSVSTFDSGVQQGANLIAAGDQAPNTGPCVTNMKRAGATLGTAQALCEVTDAIGSVSGVDLSTLQLAIICKDASGSLLLTTGCGANPTDPPASFVVCARAHLHSVTGLLSSMLDGLWANATGSGTIPGSGAAPTFDAYNTSPSGPNALACPSGASYTVTFDANGGGGTMNPETSNTQTALSPNQFTPPAAGEQFLDWTDGSGNTYPNQALYSFTADDTITAQWGPPPTYSVTYEATDSDGNAPTSGTAPNDATSPYTSGATVSVLGNTGVPPLALSGYAFEGWCTTDNAGNPTVCTGTSYTAGEKFVISADTTLYAQWAVTTYTLTYTTTNSDGTPTTGGAAPTFYQSPYPSAATVTVLGNPGSLTLTQGTTTYTFYGWCTTDTDALAPVSDPTACNGNSYVEGGTFTISGNVTLYAQWTT